MEKCEGVEAFIEVLNANGVENIFFNPGGEQGSILATISKYRVSGRPSPRLVLCLDESVAMTAAHGHYMVSGRPQVVMVHSELGTLQVGGALHNAQWGRIPLILWAGSMTVGKRLNWMKEPYDQGLIVRNCVKWDHEIKPEENIHDVLQKAFQIAYTEPCGPVYLSYPRDTMTRKVDKVTIPLSARASVYSGAQVDNTALNKVADILLDAERPIIIPGYTGRHPETVPLLVKLAEILSSAVLPSQVWMNFPTNHPLCVGMEQILGSRKANPYITEADVVLAIDYDMPYASAEGAPRPDAKIIHLDVDPLTQGRPIWSRGADFYIETDSREAIPALTRIIQQKLTLEKSAKLKERFIQLESQNKKQRKEWQNLAMSKANQKPISPDWLCRCLAEIIDEDTIVVHHNINMSASATEQIERTKPGTWLGCAAGSIQWALGAAFGAKVAAPDKTVVSLMTDGGFIWGCPVASLWSAKSYQTPFLAVIFNNSAYGFIRGMVERTAGEKLSDEMAFEAGVDIMPPPDYAFVAQSCSGYGKTVSDPTDIPSVLNESMEQVRHGKPAVVNVITER